MKRTLPVAFGAAGYIGRHSYVMRDGVPWFDVTAAVQAGILSNRAHKEKGCSQQSLLSLFPDSRIWIHTQSHRYLCYDDYFLALYFAGKVGMPGPPSFHHC